MTENLEPAATVARMVKLAAGSNGDCHAWYHHVAALVSSMSEGPLFGAVERRLFRATAVLLSVVVLVCLVATIAWVFGLALAYFYNLILPLSVAGILALVLYPAVNYLEQLSWINRLPAALIVVSCFLGIVAAIVVLVLPALARELAVLVDLALPILLRWQDDVLTHFPGIAQLIKDSAEDGELKEAMPGLDGTGRTLKSVVGGMAGLSFVPLLLFFALLSGGRLHERITSVLAVFSTKTQKQTIYFMEVFLAQVTGFFQGQLVIALIMGILFAIGFTIIDLKAGILIGLALGLLNIVPFLGTITGLLIVLPLAYLQPSGGLSLLGLSLVVFTTVQLVESWILTPKIMADRSGLHPALVVIAVFFWGTVFGSITGMILAVPLTAFLITVWSQAKASLSRSMTSEHEASRIETPSGTAPKSTSGDS